MTSNVCLRDGALAGRRIARFGAAAAGDACVAAGGDVVELRADPLDEEAFAAEVAALSEADAVIADAATAFVRDGGGYEALRGALDRAFAAARAVAAEHLFKNGGKVVFVAPRPETGEHAGALRAALENTARTLSTEWARLSVTAVAVLPGTETVDAELAETVAFLVSEAGDYYTGCALEMQ
jgi:NAD(P)-dependent dehydrogenase (short-subunit alcohol dehydrogenase family)